MTSSHDGTLEGLRGPGFANLEGGVPSSSAVLAMGNPLQPLWFLPKKNPSYYYYYYYYHLLVIVVIVMVMVTVVVVVLGIEPNKGFF